EVPRGLPEDAGGEARADCSPGGRGEALAAGRLDAEDDPNIRIGGAAEIQHAELEGREIGLRTSRLYDLVGRVDCLVRAKDIRPRHAARERGRALDRVGTGPNGFGHALRVGV